jgi:hypothetical protein
MAIPPQHGQVNVGSHDGPPEGAQEALDQVAASRGQVDDRAVRCGDLLDQLVELTFHGGARRCRVQPLLRSLPRCFCLGELAARFEHARAEELVGGVERLQRSVEQLALDLGVLAHVLLLSALLLPHALVLLLGCQEHADPLLDGVGGLTCPAARAARLDAVLAAVGNVPG